jgi:uncharacterized protein YndB with AHSA1/START domain
VQTNLATRTKRPAAVCVSRRFRAPPERVFRAWLDPQIAGRWLFATALRPMARVEIDARVAGSFCFVDRQERATIEHTGEYIEIVPHRRLVFTLCRESRPDVVTRVVVGITALKKGCELVLTHEYVPPECVHYVKARWTGILYGLGVTLDSRSDD